MKIARIDSHSIKVPFTFGGNPTGYGGRNWTTLQPAGPFADVKQLEFVSSQIGWALRRISPYLIKTLDGGRTWTSVLRRAKTRECPLT